MSLSRSGLVASVSLRSMTKLGLEVKYLAFSSPKYVFFLLILGVVPRHSDQSYGGEDVK